MNQLQDILKLAYVETKDFLFWAQIMGMPRQDWANFFPNSLTLIFFYIKNIPSKFPWDLKNQIRHTLKTAYLSISFLGPKLSACVGKNGQICYQTSLTLTFFVSKTFPESLIKIQWTKFKIPYKRRIWDQTWPILGLNDGHAWARIWWTRPGMNGQACYQNIYSQLVSCQESVWHFISILPPFHALLSQYLGWS